MLTEIIEHFWTYICYANDKRQQCWFHIIREKLFGNPEYSVSYFLQGVTEKYRKVNAPKFSCCRVTFCREMFSS